MDASDPATNIVIEENTTLSKPNTWYPDKTIKPSRTTNKMPMLTGVIFEIK